MAYSKSSISLALQSNESSGFTTPYVQGTAVLKRHEYLNAMDSDLDPEGQQSESWISRKMNQGGKVFSQYQTIVQVNQPLQSRFAKMYLSFSFHFFFFFFFFFPHSNQAQLSTNPKMQFLDTLLLEESRIRLGISAKKRNSLLASMGLRIDYFNPNRFIFYREPEILSSKLLIQSLSHTPWTSQKALFSIFLFWLLDLSSLSGLCEKPKCKNPNTPGIQQCAYCLSKICPNCLSSQEMKVTNCFQKSALELFPPSNAPFRL